MHSHFEDIDIMAMTKSIRCLWSMVKPKPQRLRLQRCYWSYFPRASHDVIGLSTSQLDTAMSMHRKKLIRDRKNHPLGYRHV
jgi:hypothetical protein